MFVSMGSLNYSLVLNRHSIARLTAYALSASDSPLSSSLMASARAKQLSTQASCACPYIERLDSICSL